MKSTIDPDSWATGEMLHEFYQEGAATGRDLDSPAQIFRAPLGDLLWAYIKHRLTLPWKRQHDWHQTEARIRNALNHITIEWHE